MSIPSQVTDEPYLHVEVPWVASDSEWRECGKWSLIHALADLRFVDHAWAALRPLVEDGTLVGLKVSTAAKRKEGSVVLCYTRPGKEEARRSAGAIRRAVDFPRMMYYKLNGQTEAGVANRYGSRNFSLYAHTYCGSFYSRNFCGTWNLDTSEEQISVPDASLRRFPGSNDGPSTVNRTYLSRGTEGTGPKWYLYCPLTTTSRDHQCLPEADRVWAVAGRLFEEGAAQAISWRKREDSAEIRLCVARETDVLDWLRNCDRIFEGASTGTFLYYNKTGKNRPDSMQTGHPDPQYTYKYTRDGELYEKERFLMRNTYNRTLSASSSSLETSHPDVP